MARVSDGAAAWNDAAATMADPASLEEFFYLERDHLIRMAVVTGNRHALRIAHGTALTGGERGFLSARENGDAYVIRPSALYLTAFWARRPF